MSTWLHDSNTLVATIFLMIFLSSVKQRVFPVR